MIARVSIALPFFLWIPEAARFSPFEIQGAPFRLVVNPPLQLKNPMKGISPLDSVPVGDSLVARLELEFNEVVKVETEEGGELQRTAAVNLFHVDIHAPEFDRSEASARENAGKLRECAFKALEEFFRRLRLLTRSIDLRLDEEIRSGVQYLDDSYRELPEESGKVRRVGGLKGTFTITVLTESTWRKSQTPVAAARWRLLHLDALKLRMHPGPAIVLSATAIETLVDTVLDHVAGISAVPPELWEWIRDRDNDYGKTPSFKERAGKLLKYLSGKSLKDDAKLWMSFVEIKRARDEFVHQGILKREESDVSKLLAVAGDVLDYLEQFLPGELRSPVSEGVKIGVNLEMRNVRPNPVTAWASMTPSTTTKK